MEFTQLVTNGDLHPAAMVGLALVLGALHGLEPGHSKTMMAAFIIAVRGTVPQAVILGLSAAISHSLIVWVLALLGLTYGDALIAEAAEPWFMAVSGMVMLAVAVWVFRQTWRNRAGSVPAHDHHHHDHTHSHGPNHDHDHDHPHPHGPGHGHSHGDSGVPAGDAHAATHAREIETRFASGKANTGQVIAFGLTGGLVPCAAAVTVLILCLHLQKFWLGVGLVGAFSVGLALTLVAAGVVAAWGLAVVRRKTRRVDALFARAPYVSALLIAGIGVAMLASGFAHLGPHAA